jgi:hypothetical protein
LSRMNVRLGELGAFCVAVVVPKVGCAPLPQT